MSAHRRRCVYRLLIPDRGGRLSPIVDVGGAADSADEDGYRVEIGIGKASAILHSVVVSFRSWWSRLAGGDNGEAALGAGRSAQCGGVLHRPAALGHDRLPPWQSARSHAEPVHRPMARRGTHLHNAPCTPQPLCGPARSSLQTHTALSMRRQERCANQQEEARATTAGSCGGKLCFVLNQRGQGSLWEVATANVHGGTRRQRWLLA